MLRLALARGNTVCFFYGIARESKRNAISIIPVELINTESGICCFKDDNSNGVAVSLEFLAKVHVDRDAGGLVRIESFPDMTEW